MKEVRIVTREWPPTLSIDLDDTGSFVDMGVLSVEDYEFAVRVQGEWRRVQELLARAIEARGSNA
jgi:hypothetical protein